MVYTIEIHGNAAKKIRKIPIKSIIDIIQKISMLSSNPFPNGYTKLTGVDGYRIRSGDYRILYSVGSSTAVLTIMNIGHRKNVYE